MGVERAENLKAPRGDRGRAARIFRLSAAFRREVPSRGIKFRLTSKAASSLFSGGRPRANDDHFVRRPRRHSRANDSKRRPPLLRRARTMAAARNNFRRILLEAIGGD